ncbi:hypothetical protein FD13_GL000815 [Levilactobacillus senmaizukei DSM 21775 = NBRC 103853]|uniref:Uncharacterized protein n=1 Tax=Levilactobacillus senmaizukei DSM 21775 = NBRC 103853 TaxID=1423803 RepID=A0A0R2DMQ8_9LACO|nr:hypothetical protein [Levilactobacillus senmaizukei]KRN03061.1 hypothetical protein FD13_GL000815 [Levilactobacillus senmaizukei DSM 21775 = NBRC 103853]
MQQIIFLVTSLDSIHKPNFSKQLLKALQEQVPVTVLVTVMDFAATWTVREYLNRLVKHHADVANVKLVTLADLFSQEAGLALTADERHAAQLDQLDERLFADSEEQVKRYLRAGHLVAELRQLDNETPMVLRQYHSDQLQQIDTYGLTGTVIGIEKIQNEVAQTSYLLNEKGEAVLRFVRHDRPVEQVYNLSTTSAMLATKFGDAKQNATIANMTQRDRDKANEEAIDHTSIVSTTETYFGVLVYANYRRFDNLYAFYQDVLSKMMTPKTCLYVDLGINAAFSPQMPNQLIFNY